MSVSDRTTSNLDIFCLQLIKKSFEMQEKQLAPDSGYMPQLDALRAFAVFAVLVSNYLPESFTLNCLETYFETAKIKV